MIVKRPKDERGPTHAGWLHSMHTFSFGHYHDPQHMGFGPLRVINDDHVMPSAGFGTHPHSNMEIVSYVIDGELVHRDSMNNGSTIKPGDIQLMSAGTGVTHSEFNGSDQHQVHFLQIWIMPDVENTEPSYQQHTFEPSEMHNAFRVVVSPNGENGSLVIKQDARVLVGKFEHGTNTVFKTQPGRKYWLHIAQGDANINGDDATAGDGFAFTDEQEITIAANVPNTKSEILLFDLPQ